MKRGNISHWTNISQCQNLLFFAQLANELLFDYSIPSNRIPTLNSHFLCLDALSAISSIDNNGVPEGTLKPIMEELYSALSKDTLYILTGEKPLHYFVKYQSGKYRYSSNVNELNYIESKKIVSAINKKYFSGNSYFNKLKDKVIEIIIENKTEQQDSLFRITKSLLTEMVNLGYNSNFIFEQLRRCFFKYNEICSPDQINCFFEPFTFEKHNYNVVFVADKQINTLIEQLDDLSCLENYPAKTTSKIEKFFLKKNKEQDLYLEIERKALDPYSAAERAKKVLITNAAFYRMCDHNYVFNIEKSKCGVYDKDNHFTLIIKSISAVQRAKTPSRENIIVKMNAAEKALSSVSNHGSYKDYFALLNAASFHTLSLDSSSEQNQLLDLWAIFESILDISNKHTSDRIQQICIYLVPILKRHYIFSLFSQLANDIKNYSLVEYDRITNSQSSKFEAIQKICEFVILEEKEDERSAFINMCDDFPLLKERITYYNQVLSTPNGIYNFVEKHSDRVRWQIMRIYRNRNLIIHNGDSMPYLKLLVENLHSYVDDFLNYIINSLSNGNSVDSMCQELFSKECEWLKTFSNKATKIKSNIIRELLQQ